MRISLEQVAVPITEKNMKPGRFDTRINFPSYIQREIFIFLHLIQLGRGKVCKENPAFLFFPSA